MHPRQSPDPLASIQCSFQWPTLHPLIIKMGASRQPPRKSLRYPKCYLLLGEQGVTANKPKFIRSQRILGGSSKHFQEGKWPPFLGAVGLLDCAPLPGLPVLHFPEPWLAKMGPTPCRWHFPSVPISLPCPIQLLTSVLLAANQPDWPMSRL